jgi:WD40 repeat protein
MHLAYQAGEDADLGQVLSWLGRARPQGAKARDLRGWEWHFLNRLAHPSHVALEGHTHEVFGVCFSPGGKHLATCSWDHTVRVWDAHTGRPLRTLRGHTAGVSGLAYSPDGRRLASHAGDGTVRVWDPHTGQQLLAWKAPGLGGAYLGITWLGGGWLTFSPDGARLLGTTRDGAVRIWDGAPRR